MPKSSPRRNCCRVVLLGVTACVARLACPSRAAEVAPALPDFGPNVQIIDPSDAGPALQGRLDAMYRQQRSNQFGAQRCALLFKPGTYRADVRVGFYTQVLGLGSSPDDVTIRGKVEADAGWMKGNATCNFWRSAENLAIEPAGERAVDTWAVSQGTALRRVHVRGGLKLWDGGWSSGGFLADSQIDSYVESGSQQQWLSRNVDWGSWRGGNWNMVFVGVNDPPAGGWPSHPYTVIDRTPVVREKPYLTIDARGRFSVVVPPLRKQTIGRSWGHAGPAGTSLSIDTFLIARANVDTADTINAALAAGKNLLLTPGIFHLDAPIRVSRAGTVVLGLGYATLIPDRGTPALCVDDVDGVSVGGIIFDAGVQNSPELLRVGDRAAATSHAAKSPSATSHAGDPTVLFDIVARCGGASAGRTDAFVTINSGDVIGDNLWLWRADHGAGAGWTSNPVRNGLVVNGTDVTCYGLFVEHCQAFQTLWNGNGGRVYFYQSELPYDPPSKKRWSHDGRTGYASYKVADGVATHQAFGLGIYSYFTAASLVSETAIEGPDAPGVVFHLVVTIRLPGKPRSGIAHVINGRGSPVVDTMKATLDQ